MSSTFILLSSIAQYSEFQVASPVPKHLRTPSEVDCISNHLLDHVNDLEINPANGVTVKETKRHPAKYASGLVTELIKISGSESVGDPMCGTGTLAYETGLSCALNDIDTNMLQFLQPLVDKQNCEVSFGPADIIPWSREVCIFSPPYYPRTDRKKPNAKNEAVRGAPVGFSDSYPCDSERFIGNPSGCDGILLYREGMRKVYDHLGKNVCGKMIVVTKNWTRLGVELRLDLDTILMCNETGWICESRHGFAPKPSLWSRYNAARGGGVQIEDIMVFRRA